jgi:hypothetical protein
MSYYLFLDDSRTPQKVTWVTLPENVEWVIVRNYQHFVEAIQKRGIPKFVTYDCDLCDEHYKAYFNLKESYVLNYPLFQVKCGIDCLEYLLKQCKKKGIKHPDYLLHTQNHWVKPWMELQIMLHNQRIQ